MLSSVASAIQELTAYGKLMSEGSTREAAGHLKAASSLVRRLPRPKQNTQQGTPLESSFRPTIDSVTFARSGDRYTLLNSAIRQLTEYSSLMNDHAPREAEERLMAARRTVDRLQHLPR